MFLRLGYRAAVFMDSDVPVDAAAEVAFVRAGGSVIRWRDGLALEGALFRGLPDDAVEALINRAIELHDEGVVDANITSKSNGRVKLAQMRAEKATGAYSAETRTLLGQSARMKTGGWFKSVGYMEDVTFDIVLPCHSGWSADFDGTIKALWRWIDSDS